MIFPPGWCRGEVSPPIIYTTYGGFRAVVWTDVLQGVVMVFGVILMLPLALSMVGGLDNATQHRHLIDETDNPLVTTLFQILHDRMRLIATVGGDSNMLSRATLSNEEHDEIITLLEDKATPEKELIKGIERHLRNALARLGATAGDSSRRDP